jgi:hypothetical protein
MSVNSSNPLYLSPERCQELVDIANRIVARGKGILAADESTGISEKLENCKMNIKNIFSFFFFK